MQRDTERNLVKLSPREAAVLRLLCSEALTTKAIADRLDIAESTAGEYIQSLIAELGLASRQHLMIWAWQHPKAFGRHWVERELHLPGCRCRFCSLTTHARGVRRAA